MSESSRARRVALTLAEISLWITAVLLAILLGTFVVLGQGWGMGLVRQGLALVNAGFLGRLDVASARVFPDGTVIATGARILDPEGRLIIAVDQATAHADLWRLARSELRLTHATASGVTAAFAVDEAGDLNIALAFQPRHPQPPSPPGQVSNGFAVVIDDFSVDLKRATLTIAPVHQPLAELLDARLSGRFELTHRGDVIISPELNQGALRGPLAGNVTVEGRLTLVGPELTAAATASVGDATLQASSELDLDKLSGTVDLASLVVGPRLLSTWLGPRHPRGLRASGAARLSKGLVRLDAFALRPLEGAGEIDATGSLDLASGNGEAHVSGQHVDARAFFTSLPTSSASFDLAGSFEEIFRDDRSGKAHFRMEPWRWDGQLVGPGQLDAEARGKSVSISNLDLAVPGARVIGEAKISDRRVVGRANVDASNLGRLRSAVEIISGVKLPEVDGDARVQASADGSFSDLALHGDVHSNHASLNGLRSHGLVATIEAPRIGSHMDLRAHVVLDELQVADETFNQIDLSLGWTTPELLLLAKATNRGQAERIRTLMIVPPSLARAELEELDLSLEGSEWKLQLPAHLDFEKGVSFKDFHLVSGQQQLGLSLVAGNDRLEITAEIQNLDLSRIPPVAFHGMKVAGLLTAALQYDDRQHHRKAQAQVAVSALAIDRLRVPTASLNASLRDSHLDASLDATLGGGKVRLRFEGPLPPQPGLLAGQLEIDDIRPGDLASFFPELKPFSGSLAIDLGLAGSWTSPRLRLTASAEQLGGPWVAKPATGVGPVSIELQLATSETSSKLQATVIDDTKPTVDLIDLRGTFGVGSRLLGALLRTPGKIPGELGGAPLQLEIETTPVPLLAVGRIVPELSTARGSAQMKADLSGSPRAPRGKLDLALREFGFPHRHLGTVDLHATAEASGLSLHADITPPPKEGGRATAVAFWGLRPEQLGEAGARSQAPLRADLQASDLSLALVLGRRSDLKGLARANASLRGSLHAPAVKAEVALTSLQVVDKPAGDLAASAEWDGQKLIARLTGSQPAGGKIRLNAELPFSAAGIGTGPLRGRLEATAFDLSTFNPVLVQTHTVRALGGILNADLSFGGTRAAPEPNGTLSLSEGELALAGLGELQHVILSLRVDPDSLVIERLVANSGGGPLTLQLTATRSGKQELALNGHLDTKRFGIYVDDQLRAFLSSESDIKGKVTFPGPGADVSVSVRRASVQVPTLTQRDLAPTTLDPDIHILTWRGSTDSEAKAEESSAEPPRPIYLRISAPGPIEVRGPDVQITAKANLAVRIASDVDLTGLVSVERGDITALGRTFKIYRTNIQFGDSHGDFAPPSSARLDVEAGQEIDGYRITMVVLGRLDHPVPQLSSDPPLPQAQISQMLASGSSEGASDAQSQTGGNSIASNLLVEGMKTWLKINPPVDVLTVDPNRLEAGKRITAHLYVGVTDNYAAVTDPRVNGTEVHARYDLGHHFALDGRYGTSQAGSFDLQWRHNW